MSCKKILHNRGTFGITVMLYFGLGLRRLAIT
jgi:hypothetical protein